MTYLLLALASLFYSAAEYNVDWLVNICFGIMVVICLRGTKWLIRLSK